MFRNRKHAGQELARLLKEKGYNDDYLVLGLPRGGVIVAYEVARELGAPMDVCIVRKIGAPGQEELALGALGPDKKAFLNHALMSILRVSREEIEETIENERNELDRRTKHYRKGRPPLDFAGRDVLVVDDGLATGMSMKVAVQAIREYHVRSLHVAVPVASDEALEMIARLSDGVVCLATPEPFYGVGQWFDDFSQTSDEEVLDLLARPTRHVDNSLLSS
jgi:putative phosphoribosyl transferase